MNPKYFLNLFTAAGLFLSAGCDSGQSDDKEGAEQQKPRYHASETEAAESAKQDLLSVMEKNNDLKLGVSREDLQNANPGKNVKWMTLNYESLLRIDTNTRFSALVGDQMNTVVPMVNNGRVVTVVTLTQQSEGWSVSGLASAWQSEDLNTVRQASGSDNIVAYEVPNLQGVVYEVSADGGKQYFARVQDRFSLRQPVADSVLLPILKEEAMRWEKMHGDKLKQNEQLLR